MSTQTHEFDRVTRLGPIIRTGALILAGFVAILGAWAALAPISGAVIAAGQVVSDGKSQILTHEQGGVVAAIHKAEGERVAPGDVILALDPVEQQGSLDQLVTRLAGIGVKLARLEAERDGRAFPPEADVVAERFANLDAELVSELIANQSGEYESRSAKHTSELASLRAELDATDRRREGAVAEAASLERQRQSIIDEIALRREADSRGFGQPARLRELERELARLDGSLAAVRSEAAALREQMSEIKERFQATEAAYANTVAAELAELRAEQLELSQKLDTARNAVSRVEVRADSGGIINSLRVNTVGSAVEPFAPLVEVVPDKADLLVEARVSPIDIDEVEIGQEASVVFSAFQQQQDDPLPATVTFVSADSHQDNKDGTTYYTARLSVARDALSNVPPVVPGMPAQVFLRTGDHTLLQYLVQPVTASFARAFR